MHGIIERKTLRFAGRNTANTLFASGIPGPHDRGGAVVADIDAAALAAYIQSAVESSVKLDLMKRNGMDVRYIGIAADSAIPACDISLGGEGDEQHRHRISVGNPLVGCLSADVATVTVPHCPPTFAYGALVKAVTAIHDFSSVVGAGSSEYVGWPLRLEIGYGDIIPVRSHARAEYVAHGIFNVASTDVRALYLCTAGRRRIDINVVNIGVGIATITADSIWPRKDNSNDLVDAVVATPLPLLDDGSTSVPVLAGGSAQFSYFGNPMLAMRVNIAQSVGASVVQLHITANDY